MTNQRPAGQGPRIRAQRHSRSSCLSASLHGRPAPAPAGAWLRAVLGRALGVRELLGLRARGSSAQAVQHSAAAGRELMYAEQSHPNADAYNCVQRAHQNMLENLSIFYVLLFTSAVFRPRVASIAGFVRILGFIVYVLGYSTGDPQKRLYAEFGHFATLVQVGLTIEAGIKMLGIKDSAETKKKTGKSD